MSTNLAPKIDGLHHMTAITQDGQSNLDFYTGVLGMRLTKVTVNFDDPSAYHLYYGDANASVGSNLTFFPYRGGRAGMVGPGQVGVTGLRVRPEAIPYWRERLGQRAVDLPSGALQVTDPDGIVLHLEPDPTYVVETPWRDSPVPADHQIGAMSSVTLVESQVAPTEHVLSLMGYQKVSEGRWEVGGGGSGRVVKIVIDPDERKGNGGHGSVHHIAFRTPDDDHQLAWKDRLYEEGFRTSPVMNRDYFHSIYFREPGGVLFEIATDGPGFFIDEDFESLGTGLKLPKMYESQRVAVEASLEPLRLPNGSVLGGRK